MKSLLKYLKNYKKESILGPLFKMLEASFELLIPIVMANIIDVGIKNRDTGYVLKMGVLMAVLGLIGLTCSLTAQFFAAKAAVGFGTALRHDLFVHIQNFSYTEIDRMGTSTLMNRMTNDVNQVQSGINLVLRLFLRSPFIVFGAMVMAFTINVKCALIFVVTIPLLSLVVFGVMTVSIPMYKKVQSRLDKVLQITRENLSGVRVIRAFNRQMPEKKAFAEANDRLVHQQIFVGKISAAMNPVTYVLINSAIIVLIWTGALEVKDGIITQGEVVALVNYMSQILVELVKLANLIINITKSLACAKRIEVVLETESSLAEGHISAVQASDKAQAADVVQAADKAQAADVVQASGKAQAADVVQGQDRGQKAERRQDIPAVTFHNVSFKYDGAGEESLTGIDFSAGRGETVGIIGGTGSGKTSLINLIPRFYDVSAGQVCVDGVNVRDYTFEALRDKIGIVPQKAVLFKGTIAENLRWGRTEATEDELMEAVRAAQAEEIIEAKDGGLDAAVMQGGRNFSGGQRQRLTIARALVRKPHILILDDSASALDYATDARLRKAIGALDGEMTVFIVSQRAASVWHADKIIVLDDGRVAGIGTHDELLRSCGTYQEIYYSQFPKEGGKNE